MKTGDLRALHLKHGKRQRKDEQRDLCQNEGDSDKAPHYWTATTLGRRRLGPRVGTRPLRGSKRRPRNGLEATHPPWHVEDVERFGASLRASLFAVVENRRRHEYVCMDVEWDVCCVGLSIIAQPVALRR